MVRHRAQFIFFSHLVTVMPETLHPSEGSHTARFVVYQAGSISGLPAVLSWTWACPRPARRCPARSPSCECFSSSGTTPPEKCRYTVWVPVLGASLCILIFPLIGSSVPFRGCSPFSPMKTLCYVRFTLWYSLGFPSYWRHIFLKIWFSVASIWK